jgi:TolA-binding protein
MDQAKCALIASLALACTCHVFATGDYYEDSLPTLSEVLNSGQLPAKTIAEIAREDGAKPAAAGKVDFKAEILALAKLPAAKALAAVDKLLPAARAAQPIAGPGITNLLHDLRDLFAFGKATAEEIAAYVEWRVEHPDSFGFDWEGGSGRRDSATTATELLTLKQRAAEASPALKPHWLYLCGAAEFKSGDDTGSEVCFQQVIDEYPVHPRAEAAQFMVARCLLSQSRDISDDTKAAPGYSYTSKAEGRAKAQKAFQDYLAKYPKGRFAGDVLGWLGAAAYDAQDYVAAARYYVQQAEIPDHPELAASAGLMGEKVLSRLASAPDDAQFAELAKTPIAALGLVYLILNTTESDDFNGETDDPAQVREWRREILPRVAKAIAANEGLYKDAKWRPRYLAMLVLAASGAGDQAEAIRLSELAGAAKSEDLLFARGVAMQRAKRPKEAAAAFEELVKTFPNGALAPEVAFRLAFALFDDHRAGEALTNLLTSAPPNDESNNFDEHPGRSALEPGQYAQLIDAIYNFAPVPELIAGANTPRLDAALRLKITEVIAQRLLAKEQFDEAKKFMPAAQWGLVAEKLESLTLSAKSAKAPEEKAAACFALGEAWATARGKLLTAPLDTDKYRREIFLDDHALADARRVENAHTLAVAANYQLDLANRDELRHAFNWWIEASDAQPKTPLAAKALWRALRAMPVIADVSPFHYARAIEQKWGDVSRKLCERLKKENPTSDEARRLAVYWNFPPPPKEKDGEQDVEDSPASDDSPRGTMNKEGEHWAGFNPLPEDGESGDTDKDIEGEILKFGFLVRSTDMPALKKTADRLQKHAHEGLRAFSSSPVVNYIDDLATFFSGLDPGPAARLQYVRLRGAALELAVKGVSPVDSPGIGSDEDLRVEIEKALADPKLQKIADYFTFLDCAVVANHICDIPFPGVDKDGEPYTYRSRDFAELEKLTRAFLEKYPRSRKREAGLLLHAKALHYGMKTQVFDRVAAWPVASRWEGSANPLTSEQIPFNRARLKGALDQYDKEFPRGRYAKEIRHFRGALALRARDWKTAVETTIAQLDDTEKPSLQPDASERLEAIFDELSDDAARPELLAVIKANPQARKRLMEMIEDGGGNAMFTCLTAWLREQMVAR